ncbi:MAG: hypothetical protein PHH13_01295 [Candidatus Peribacteraceae bacterium]|nr:hypothetical protein [Candidatus Peribacteraceae bacterium]
MSASNVPTVLLAIRRTENSQAPLLFRDRLQRTKQFKKSATLRSANFVEFESAVDPPTKMFILLSFTIPDCLLDCTAKSGDRATPFNMSRRTVGRESLHSKHA